MKNNRQRAVTAGGIKRNNFDIQNKDFSQVSITNQIQQSQQQFNAFSDRPFSHVSISKLGVERPIIQLMPEGVQMCHVNLQKKETEEQLKLLQNRLELLRRQEQFIHKTASQNTKTKERLNSLIQNAHKDQQQIQLKVQELQEIDMANKKKIQEARSQVKESRLKSKITLQSQKMHQVFQAKAESAQRRQLIRKQADQLLQQIIDQKQVALKEKLKDKRILSHKRAQKSIIIRKQYNRKISEAQREVQLNIEKMSELQWEEKELINRIQHQTMQMKQKNQLGVKEASFPERLVSSPFKPQLIKEIEIAAAPTQYESRRSLQSHRSLQINLQSNRKITPLDQHSIQNVVDVQDEDKRTSKYQVLKQLPSSGPAFHDQSLHEIQRESQEKSYIEKQPLASINSDQQANSSDFEEVKDSELQPESESVQPIITQQVQQNENEDEHQEELPHQSLNQVNDDQSEQEEQPNFNEHDEGQDIYSENKADLDYQSEDQLVQSSPNDQDDNYSEQESSQSKSDADEYSEDQNNQLNSDSKEQYTSNSNQLNSDSREEEQVQSEAGVDLVAPPDSYSSSSKYSPDEDQDDDQFN